MRKALAEALDEAIAFGQAAQRDRRNGQMNLFGGDNGLGGMEQPEPTLSTAEWSEAEMLAREKAVLGFYITRHPLANQERLLAACGTATTVDLARYNDGDTVVIGGMVSSLRTVTARGGRSPGKQLGILSIEDLKGRMDAILFPDDLAKYRPVLVPDELVFVEGSVDRRREEPSLRVSRVVLANEALTSFASALLVDVTDQTPVEEMAEVLRLHHGESPVYLNVETSDGLVAQIECHPRLRVACTPELLGALTEMLGRDAVCVLGANRRAIPFDLASGTHARAVETAAV
jgi:DNA polymerase-3 subunit alpha